MKSLAIHLVCLLRVLSAAPILAQAEAGSDGLYSTKENIKWWIQANSDGTLVKTDHPAAVQYMLIVEYGRPYQGNKFDRLSLSVSKADGTVHVMDRSKPPTKDGSP